MQLTPHKGDTLDTVTDLLVIGVHQGALPKSGAAADANRALGGALYDAAKDQDFSGKPRQSLVLHTLGGLKAKRICLWGLGEKQDLNPEAYTHLGAATVATGNDVGARSALLCLPAGKRDGAAEALGRGATLGSYRFEDYTKAPRARTLSKISLEGSDAAEAKAWARGVAVGQGICLARDLVNISPLQLYPESYASRIRRVFRGSGVEVTVLAPPELRRRKMNLLLGVGAGSSRSPRLVHMRYRPRGTTAHDPVVLVGKGITFDSGGLSLKPPPSMMDMKMDMGGSAAVVGALKAIADLKLKVAVDGVVALAENMPSGTAIRPGDVIRSAAGMTVEVNNTDAEGRLVLADALHYAGGLKPARVIDLATLTGACMVALGPTTVGLFANDDKLARDLQRSAEATGEDFWRMPLTESLKAQLKSDCADMKNTGERWGGAITAALFLQEFAPKAPWAHLDIAGPAMIGKATALGPKGGSGVGVATLVDLLTRA